MTRNTMCAVLVALSGLGSASIAAPVDHNSPSGIAAVAPLFGKLSYTSARGEKLGFPVVAVDVHGAVFSINYEGELKPFGFSGGNSAEWPVEFALITEWTPAAVEVPWYDHPIVTMGTILTSDGDRWFHSVKKVSGDWDQPGQIIMEFVWKRLTVSGR